MTKTEIRAVTDIADTQSPSVQGNTLATETE